MGKKKKRGSTAGADSLELNRRARFDYEFIEELEAGLVLHGSEVKSIRDGKASLQEAWCQFKGDELWLVQAHVAEFPQAHARNHDPVRPRKLLLQRRQLEQLNKAVQRDGLTIVPVELYIKERHIKLRIALGRGKKTHDKRASIKERDQKREMQRALRDRE